jgi:hypothetical protein
MVPVPEYRLYKATYVDRFSFGAGTKTEWVEGRVTATAPGMVRLKHGDTAHLAAAEVWRKDADTYVIEHPKSELWNMATTEQKIILVVVPVMCLIMGFVLGWGF